MLYCKFDETYNQYIYNKPTTIFLLVTSSTFRKHSCKGLSTVDKLPSHCYISFFPFSVFLLPHFSSVIFQLQHEWWSSIWHTCVMYTVAFSSFFCHLAFYHTSLISFFFLTYFTSLQFTATSQPFQNVYLYTNSIFHSTPSTRAGFQGNAN